MPTRVARAAPPPTNINEAGHQYAEGRKRFKKLTAQRRGYQIDRWVELTAAMFGDGAAKAMRRAMTSHLKGVPLAFDNRRSFEATHALLDLLNALPKSPSDP